MITFEQILPENGIVIGEIACGHEGDLTKIFQLIDVHKKNCRLRLKRLNHFL